MRLQVEKNWTFIVFIDQGSILVSTGVMFEYAFNIFVRIKSLPNGAKKSEQIIQLFVSELALFHKRQLFFVWSSNTMWTWNAQESHVGVASKGNLRLKTLKEPFVNLVIFE